MCIMTAKYDGQCRACGRAIRAGSQIDYSKSTGARHVSCAQGRAPSRTTAAPRTQARTPTRREPGPGEQIVSRRSAGRTDLYDIGSTRHMPKVQGAGGGPDGHYWTVLSAWYSPRCEDNQQFDALACAIVRPATDAEASPVAAKVAAKESRESLARELGSAPAERVSVQMPGTAVVLVPRTPGRMCPTGERVAVSDGTILHERVGDPDMCDSWYHYVVRITAPSPELIARVEAYIAAGGAS